MPYSLNASHEDIFAHFHKKIIVDYHNERMKNEKFFAAPTFFTSAWRRDHNAINLIH